MGNEMLLLKFKRYVMWSWLDTKLENYEWPLFCIFLTISAASLSRAVGIAALVVQQALQSYIVYKSTVCEQQHPRERGRRDPMLTHDLHVNMLRSVAGTLLLALIDESLLTHMTNVLEKTSYLAAMKLVWCCFIGYWTTVVSEYMVHRFIWHAHWMRDRYKIARIFSHAHYHYIHHYLAHHKHAMDPDTKARMLEGSAEPHNPDKKKSFEQQHEEQSGSSALVSLDCSNHGYTIRTWQCKFSTITLYFLCPTGFSVIMHLMYRDWVSASAHLVMSTLGVYMAIHHHAYHSSREARLRWANGRMCFERWYWTSDAVNRKAEEHKKHHYSIAEHGDIEFCGVLPYGHFVLFPIWQMW